jgi:hypothetical protein
MQVCFCFDVLVEYRWLSKGGVLCAQIWDCCAGRCAVDKPGQLAEAGLPPVMLLQLFLLHLLICVNDKGCHIGAWGGRDVELACAGASLAQWLKAAVAQGCIGLKMMRTSSDEGQLRSPTCCHKVSGRLRMNVGRLISMNSFVAILAGLLILRF